jgi:hypothetical protein
LLAQYPPNPNARQSDSDRKKTACESLQQSKLGFILPV